jgi:aspartokinase
LKKNIMQVLKFGGSSVGTTDAISKVIAIVKERVQKTPTMWCLI